LFIFGYKNTSTNAFQEFKFNDKSERKGNWSQLTFQTLSYQGNWFFYILFYIFSKQ